MKLVHPIEQLHRVSQRLAERLRGSAIEVMPEEVSVVLLDQSGGDHTDAIWNGWEYLACRRPLTELAFELSVLALEEEPEEEEQSEPRPLTMFDRFVKWVLGLKCL